MHETSAPTRQRKTNRVNRTRLTMSFSLSTVVAARVRYLAHQRGCSVSRVIEDHIASIDFPGVFLLFEQRVPFAQIVIQTGLTPMVIREVYADYLLGLGTPVAPPPLPAVPPAPPAPLLNGDSNGVSAKRRRPTRGVHTSRP
jgi:hypothetical protein